jgi:CSLREA domain-containing protein
MSIHTNTRGRIGLLGESRTLTMAALLAVVIAVLSLAPAHSARAAIPADTFTVTEKTDASDLDPGDGDCDVSSVSVGFDCSLRAAIQEANATPEPDLIRFSIIDASGVKTIQPTSPLPAITAPVTIDGYTQTGASPNTKDVGNDAVLKIALDGANAGADARGLEVTSTSGDSVIRGLAVNRFSTGIAINGDSLNNRIEGNFIGAGSSGAVDKGNRSDGVLIVNSASQNVVGGTTPAARNLISGNDGNGILVDGGFGNLIQGNYIGTDKSGTSKLGNTEGGVRIDGSSGNTIGGTISTARNLISGNDTGAIGVGGASGVRLFSGSGNEILGNRIGTTANGTGPLGNFLGVAITFTKGNKVGDGSSGGANTVAFNTTDGIAVDGGGISVNNRVDRNSVFSNGGLGIDLGGGVENTAGVTANDLGDPDGGANNLQNFPVITSAKTLSGKATIAGKLNSTPRKSFVIQYYSNPKGTNEGKKFLGQEFVTTNDNGNVTFTSTPALNVVADANITATATNLDGDTSEFSAPRTVVLASGSALSPETTKLGGPSGVTKNPTAHFKFEFPDPDATFECSLDGGAYYGCSSPENINQLSGGRHTFGVRATDGIGNVDPSPARWIWAVERND